MSTESKGTCPRWAAFKVWLKVVHAELDAEKDVCLTAIHAASMGGAAALAGEILRKMNQMEQ